MNPINAIIVRARAARLFALGALFGLCLAAASAQEVGQVNFVQGVTSAQSPGGQPRFLAKGDAIAQGEVVSTSERGYAVLGLKDGTKLTLRSNTAFAVDELNQQTGSESLAMNLFRGGLRAITGLISKSRSNSTRLIAPNATIGIRGTEFDARLCGVECRREAQFARPPPPAARQDEVVARVVALNGDASALGRDGATRALANGAAVFNGESVRTGADSHAVLAFRDQTKVTLIEKTAFNLEDVRMTGPAAQGSFVARLVSGGLRAVTGLIGRTNRGNVKIVTATATIGIRGTGLDLRLLPDGTYLYTWDGAAALEADGEELVVEKDRAGVLRTPAACCSCWTRCRRPSSTNARRARTRSKSISTPCSPSGASTTWRPACTSGCARAMSICARARAFSSISGRSRRRFWPKAATGRYASSPCPDFFSTTPSRFPTKPSSGLCA
ncbi:MAG: FecR domain-containing protein [Sulfuritalea sp.]|nr:FecR domain-containing protein [Sulfuritalea sp.]